MSNKSYYYKDVKTSIGPQSRITLPLTLPYTILLFLKANNQNTIYVKDVSIYLERNYNQISQIVHKLEKDKYLKKLKDGRRRILCITEKGTSFINKYLEILINRIKDFFRKTGLKNQLNEKNIETSNHNTGLEDEYKIKKINIAVEKLEKLLENKELRSSTDIFSQLNLNLQKIEEVFSEPLLNYPDRSLHQYEVKIDKLNKLLDKCRRKNKGLKDSLRDLLSDQNKLLLTKSNFKIKGYTAQEYYGKFIYISNGLKPEIKWCDDNLRNVHLYQEAIRQLERQGRLINMFYKSREWGIRSGEILKRDKHTCEICGKGTNRVHHRSSALYNPEICLDPVNLTSMCSRCEDQIHNRV